MLKVTELTRSYGDFLAVDNVSFDIGTGEIVGLLGHNGAGKTTIMKMISGYLEPDKGEVLVDDIDLSQRPKSIQQLLGYLPENLPVYPEMTVADYLDFAANLKNLKGEQKRKSIQHAVFSIEIQDKLLDPIYTLSRGYKQRVGVAQAILGNPKLLILDEPTNGLDPTQTEHMRNLIKEIAQHATVILSTHIMQEVEALCDRVLIVHSGKLAVDAKMQDLQESNLIELSCSLDPEKVNELFNSVSAIESFDFKHAGGSVFDYTITHDSNTKQQQLSAQVAQAIVSSGAELYSLHSKKYDLEAMFREVNLNKNSTTEKEIENAA